MRSRRNHRQEFLTIYRVSAAVPGSGEQNTINVYCVTYLIDVCIRVDQLPLPADGANYVCTCVTVCAEQIELVYVHVQRRARECSVSFFSLFSISVYVCGMFCVCERGTYMCVVYLCVCLCVREDDSGVLECEFSHLVGHH